jgi:hypothetical protein
MRAFTRGAFVVGVGLLVAGGVTGCGSSSKKSSSATTAAPSTTAAASTTAAPPPPTTAKSQFTTFGDGTYMVGKTVQAGTYRAPGPGDNCYWERLSGFSGSTSDIIANNNTGDPSVITIAPTDAGFRTSGCGTWTADLSAITKSKTSFPAGTYIVGTDITPGTYNAPGGATCYWARLSGFGGTTSEILANENATGATTVTIAATDKGFESAGCGTFAS